MPDIKPTTAREGPVLIVDDNPDILLLLSTLLKTEGYRTITAGSGKEAIDCLGRTEPPVVLLDYMMPDISGFDVLREVIRIHPLTQVLIITGRGDENIATSFLKSGAADYISKPFENQRIILAIEHAIERRKEEQKKIADALAEKKVRRHLKREKKGLTAALRKKNRELEEVNRELVGINESLIEKNREITRLEKMYEEIFDKAGDGIMKLDLDGTIIMANLMAGRILGDETPRGKRLQDYLSEDHRQKAESLLSSLATGRVTLEEIELELPGHEGVRTANLRAVPLKKNGVVEELEVLMTDITERIHQQKVVKKLEERAIIAGLSRHLSHVLLNALTSAGGYLKKLIRKAPSGKEPSRYYEIIDREMEKMEEVVRGYQDYVDIMKLRPSSLLKINVFLGAFIKLVEQGGDKDIDRILRPIRPACRFDEITIAPEDATVSIDPYFLNIGLAYLIKGIIHYAAGPAGTEVTLAFRSAVSDREVTVSLVTLGTITPPETIAGMYSPWDHQMLHQSFDDWGITISHAVAEKHGGKLEILDRPDGTCYTVHLPVASR